MHTFEYHAAVDGDRHNGELRRHDHDRALAEARSAMVPRAVRVSLLDRLSVIARRRPGDDHSLTDYACRMPDGRIGRVAVIQQGGDWAMVCRAR